MHSNERNDVKMAVVDMMYVITYKLVNLEDIGLNFYKILLTLAFNI